MIRFEIPKELHHTPHPNDHWSPWDTSDYGSIDDVCWDNGSFHFIVRQLTSSTPRPLRISQSYSVLYHRFSQDGDHLPMAGTSGDFTTSVYDPRFVKRAGVMYARIQSSDYFRYVAPHGHEKEWLYYPMSGDPFFARETIPAVVNNYVSRYRGKGTLLDKKILVCSGDFYHWMRKSTNQFRRPDALGRDRQPEYVNRVVIAEVVGTRPKGTERYIMRIVHEYELEDKVFGVHVSPDRLTLCATHYLRTDQTTMLRSATIMDLDL